MKVRICPKCGRHNPENSWSCEDCGETLPMNTLFDPDKKVTKEEIIFGQLSPHFKENVDSILKEKMVAGEELLWACNIVFPSYSPPYKFGYLLITSEKAIVAKFSVDLRASGNKMARAASMILNPLGFVAKEVSGKATPPKRSHQPVWLSEGSNRPMIAVNHPSAALSENELKSLAVSSYQLKDLVSYEFKHLGSSGTSYPKLIVKFQEKPQQSPSTIDSGRKPRQRKPKKSEVVLYFYAPHYQEKAEELLSKWVKTPILPV